MRAYITALLATVALANQKPRPSGAYDYRQGGENWNTYSNSFCGQATSVQQSPINLFTTNATHDRDLNIELNGLGRSSKASRDKATTNRETDWHLAFGYWKNSATVTRTDAANKAEKFTPQGMVWHTPSEHTVDGRHFAAEAQIMSTDEAGVVAITSFFFDNVDQDTDNGFVKSFLLGYEYSYRSIDVYQIMWKVDEDDGFWQYDGSLTTPPCTEGVKWTIMKTVQPISTGQLEQFWQFTKGTASGDELNATEPQYLEFVQSNTSNINNAAGNNRKVQPLGTRKLYWKDSSTTADSVTKHDDKDSDAASALMADAASALMASALTAAAVTLLTF